MRVLVDAGYITYRWAAYPRRWELMERLAAGSPVICFDSARSLRRERYSWYKSNRGDALPPATKALQVIAKQFQQQIWQRFNHLCRMDDGLEGDDIIAKEFYGYGGDCMIVSEDHDFLQLDATLVNQRWERWNCDRIKQTNLPLRQGESYLAYQLLMGCKTDTVPRTIFSKDRTTAPWVFSQPSPLRAALSMLGEDVARASLDCLLLPTPLETGEDSIEVALRRYQC